MPMENGNIGSGKESHGSRPSIFHATIPPTPLSVVGSLVMADEFRDIMANYTGWLRKLAAQLVGNADLLTWVKMMISFRGI
jgi:hypothetical protein